MICTLGEYANTVYPKMVLSVSSLAYSHKGSMKCGSNALQPSCAMRML